MYGTHLYLSLFTLNSILFWWSNPISFSCELCDDVVSSTSFASTIQFCFRVKAEKQYPSQYMLTTVFWCFVFWAFSICICLILNYAYLNNARRRSKRVNVLSFLSSLKIQKKKRKRQIIIMDFSCETQISTLFVPLHIKCRSVHGYIWKLIVLPFFSTSLSSHTVISGFFFFPYPYPWKICIYACLCILDVVVVVSASR